MGAFNRLGENGGGLGLRYNLKQSKTMRGGAKGLFLGEGGVSQCIVLFKSKHIPKCNGAPIPVKLTQG